MTDPFSHESVQALQYETPFFLISKQKIKDKINEFKTCFPHAAIHYAMKANAEPELLQTVQNEGCSFEVASIYELKMLEELNVSPEKITFGSSVKSLAHIKYFYDYGVRLFALDSFQEVEKIAIAAPGSNVYVRMITNDAGSVFPFSEKFGTQRENIAPLLIHAKELGLNPYGISFHVGSQASNPAAWAEAIRNVGLCMEELEKVGIKIEVINLGGGYPCKYTSTEEEIALGEISKHTHDALAKLPYKTRLMLEPGRGIAAETMLLVTSVIARVERSATTWLFLDAGVYNGLFESMAYQGSTRYKVSALRNSFNGGEMLFSLAGPTGDGPDVITREAHLPSDIQVGEKLLIHNVGAYSIVAASRFNGFPKPEVYFV